MIDDQSAHNAPDDEGKAPGPDADPATDTDAVWAAPSLEVIAEAVGQMREVTERAGRGADQADVARDGVRAAQVDALVAIVLELHTLRETIAAGLRVALAEIPAVAAGFGAGALLKESQAQPAVEHFYAPGGGMQAVAVDQHPQVTPPAEVHQAIAALVRLIEDREPETYTVAKTAGTPPTQSSRQIVKTTILQEHELLAVRSAICTLADWIGAAPPEQGS